MLVALVQPLFRPRFTPEFARISIDGTICGVAGNGFLSGSYSFVRLLHRLRVLVFKLVQVPKKTISKSRYSMPPKKQRGSQNSATKEPCSICCQPIVIGKDEALFCVGKCQQWLHRYCASISVKCYKAIIDDNHSYLCPCCYRENQEERITELTNTVETMKLEIAQLKKELATAQATATTQPQRSYANVASRKTGVTGNLIARKYYRCGNIS